MTTNEKEALKALEVGKKKILAIYDEVGLEIEKSVIAIGTQKTPRAVIEVSGQKVFKPIVTFILDELRVKMSDKVLFDNVRRAIGKDRRDELEERIIYETFGVKSTKDNKSGLAFVSTATKEKFAGLEKPINTSTINSSRMVFTPVENIDSDLIKIVDSVEEFDKGWV